MSSESDTTVGMTPLQSNLALGLHAFAQPLAILRAKLFPESISAMNPEELEKLALDSAAQVERLCTLFNYLQELVLAESAEPQLSAVEIRPLLENAIDGVDLWFRDAGFQLLLHIDVAVSVLADHAKLSQSISAALLIMHGLCTAGDSVTVSADQEAGSIAIRITNEHAQAEMMRAETRLALAVIETNLRKQGGCFTCGLDPLILEILVPRAPTTN